MRKRLFWAIHLPDELIYLVCRFQQQLQYLAPRANWVKPQNMHITLAFWGEQEIGLIPFAVDTVQEALRSLRPFTLKLSRPGYFGSRNSPSVIWLGIAGDIENLYTLRQFTESSLVKFNYCPESRPFHPHLTLARLKNKENVAALLQKMDEIAAQVDTWPEFNVNHVCLVESILRPDGPVYTVLQRITLA
ncbi:MAG: RNA 2',3'-cyclic phosphodiesterase [Bacillota bacterium]